jgi:hypothetical protein
MTIPAPLQGIPRPLHSRRPVVAIACLPSTPIGRVLSAGGLVDSEQFKSDHRTCWPLLWQAEGAADPLGGEARVRHATSQVHHPTRRRGGLAACGARAAVNPREKREELTAPSRTLILYAKRF